MTVMNMRLTTLHSIFRGSLLLAALWLSPGMSLSAEPKHSLPQMAVDLGSVSYPSSALRQALQGRVLVAFTITRKGRADNPTILNAEPEKEFDSIAIKAVKQVKFTVPDTWEASGDSAYQYQLSVLFKLYPCAAPACVAPQAHESADDFLVIAAEAK